MHSSPLSKLHLAEATPPPGTIFLFVCILESFFFFCKSDNLLFVDNLFEGFSSLLPLSSFGAKDSPCGGAGTGISLLCATLLGYY